MKKLICAMIAIGSLALAGCNNNGNNNNEMSGTNANNTMSAGTNATGASMENPTALTNNTATNKATP